MDKPKQERSLLQATLENVEVAVDLVIESEAIRSVPVIGTAFHVAKALDDARSRLLLAKLTTFLTEPSLQNAAKAGKIRKRLMDEAGYDETIGETLFMVIDKVTDMSKPALLAKVFVAYIDGEIERTPLLLLAHVIDISSAVDLKHFIKSEGRDEDNEILWRQRLAGTGLYESYASGAIGGGGVEYDLAPLGSTLLHVIKYAELEAKAAQMGNPP